MDQLSPLSATTIKRRMFRFFRFHQIKYKEECGNFLLGSGIFHIVNGDICAYFPHISKQFSNHISFKVPFEDPYNSYLRIARLHNKIVLAFPVAPIRLLPDLFD